jgi:glycosyltransferase involved in cell wall biosynthesis
MSNFLPGSKLTLHLFGNPSPLGGASTKLIDFIQSFYKRYRIINYLPRTPPDDMAAFLSSHDVEIKQYSDFPAQKEGVCLAVCVDKFFETGIPQKARDHRIPLVWSNEMMWLFPGEEDAVKCGLISKVLYLSPIQKRVFQNVYKSVSSMIVDNYVNPAYFKFVDRGSREPFTIGRLSRPDPLKYPINFPTLYESLISKSERLKIQSWSSDLAAEYSWHYFSPDRWVLQEVGAEPANLFLQSIDVFSYPLGHRFIESWGRSTVEAMLTGCVPIVPSGHHLENLLVHGESGFVCQNDDDFIKWTRELCADVSLFMKMSRSAAQYSRDVICNSEANCRLWIQALEEW